jgi:hypothetical protein
VSTLSFPFIILENHPYLINEKCGKNSILKKKKKIFMKS